MEVAGSSPAGGVCFFKELVIDVFVDASGSGSVYFVGIVVFDKDKKVFEHTERVLVKNSNAAEVQAILLGKEKFPNDNIYSDNISASEAHGVIWIPRGKNVAHSITHRQYVIFRNEKKTTPKKLGPLNEVFNPFIETPAVFVKPAQSPPKNKKKLKLFSRKGYVSITLTDEHRYSPYGPAETQWE